MIRVLIADDSAVIRDGLVSCLEMSPDISIVGTAINGAEAVLKAGELTPDVVIMDAQMPEVDGIEATRRIKADYPNVRIVFFSTFPDWMQASKEAGADAYVLKDCDPDELIAMLSRVTDARGCGLA